MLHELRWRKTPPDRRRRWLVLAIVLVLHGLFAALTWQEMQVGSLLGWERARSGALQVRLIARPRTPPPVAMENTAPALPPHPPEPVRPAVKPSPTHEAPSPNAMTATLPAPAATVAPPPAPRLYNELGQPLLPAASTAPPPATSDYVQHTPQDNTKIMRHDNPVTYQPTRFEGGTYKGRTSADDALQRAVDNTTVTHTFHIAPGVRIHCGISFAALAGGCGGDPPPKPTSKSQDMRLNMAPANLVAPASSTPTPPGVDQCIAIYRADKPLPQGCPVDTPTRAVDEEMRERAAQAARQQGG